MAPRDVQRSRVIAAETKTFEELSHQSLMRLADEQTLMDRKWNFYVTTFARRLMEEAFTILPRKWTIDGKAYRLMPKTSFNRALPLQLPTLVGVTCAAGLFDERRSGGGGRQAGITFRWKGQDTQHTPHAPLAILHQLAHLIALPMYEHEGVHGPAFCRSLLAVHALPWDDDTWDDAHFPMVGSTGILAAAFADLKVHTESLEVSEYEARAKAKSDVKYAHFERTLRDLSQRLKP